MKNINILRNCLKITKILSSTLLNYPQAEIFVPQNTNRKPPMTKKN